MKTKTFTIFSQYLAGLLLCKGFVLVGVEPQKNGSGKNVFFFNNSEELQNEIRKFKNNKMHK